MNKTLIILPKLHTTEFRLKGLAIKLHADLCKDESGFYVSNDFHQNGQTATIEVDYLVQFLKELKQKIEFDSIKIKGRYEISGEALMTLVNQKK